MFDSKAERPLEFYKAQLAAAGVSGVDSDIDWLYRGATDTEMQWHVDSIIALHKSNMRIAWLHSRSWAESIEEGKRCGILI